jgi:uncharacterized protein (DUF3084 family)
MYMSSSWREHRARFVPLVLISTPLAFACATVPPPTDTVGAARIAIAEATQADAEPHARLELHMAREHLAQAEAAMEREENEKARELAEKALVEAELAEAKAESAAAKRNVAQIREDIATLRREIDRASGENR